MLRKSSHMSRFRGADHLVMFLKVMVPLPRMISQDDHVAIVSDFEGAFVLIV